jgi:hypothetical protein
MEEFSTLGRPARCCFHVPSPKSGVRMKQLRVVTAFVIIALTTGCNGGSSTSNRTGTSPDSTQAQTVSPPSTTVEPSFPAPTGALFSTKDFNVCAAYNSRPGMNGISAALSTTVDASDSNVVVGTANNQKTWPGFCEWSGHGVLTAFVSRDVTHDSDGLAPAASFANSGWCTAGTPRTSAIAGEQIRLFTGTDAGDGAALCILYRGVFVEMHVEKSGQVGGTLSESQVDDDVVALNGLYTALLSA